MSTTWNRQGFFWRSAALVTGCVLGQVLALPAAVAQQSATAEAPAVTPANATPAPAAQQLESIVVTGSNIRRTDTETPSPVQVISSAELKESGYSSLADVLHNITANNMGSLTNANAAAFGAGGSGVALRGLTVGATLTLIDGHRMAPYPMPDDGERDFVDISSIPIDAIERVEVLKDGASAVYGSDAMAGVVNVILKRSYAGTNIGAEVGASYRGDGRMEHGNFAHGWGDLGADGYNTYLTFDTRHQNAIDLSARPYLDTTTSQLDPTGTVSSTGNPFLQIQPETRNFNGLIRHTRQLGGDWQLTLAGSVFDAQATQVGIFNTAANNANGVSISFAPGTFPSFNPTQLFNNPVLLAQPGPVTFTDFGAQSQRTNTISTRLVADLNGTLGAWDVQASLGITEAATRLDLLNYVSQSAMNASLNSPGGYVVGGPNSGSLLAQLAPMASSRSTSELDFASFKGSRDLYPLPGGSLAMSAGVDLLRRVTNEHFPTSFQTGDQISAIYSFVLGQQDIVAGYAEFVAPLAKNFEFDLAGRLDHYDNYQNAFTPKAGFKYTPLQSFTVRGTLARGFRAPNPAESGNGGSTSGVLNAIYDPALCAGQAVSGAPNCNLTPPGLQLSSHNLNPERSRSFTLGLIFEPAASFNGSLDFYDIKISDQIISVGQLQQLYYNDPASVGAVLCRQGNSFSVLCSSSPGNANSGTLLYSYYGWLNANTTETSGLDVDLRYRLDLQEAGKLTFQLQDTHMIKYALTARGVTYQLAGTHGPSFISGDTGAPKERTQLSATWTKGGFEGTATINRISAISVIDPSAGFNTCADAIGGQFSGPPPGQFCTIGVFTELNVQGAYEFNKHWAVHGSITNLLNKQAPYDLQTFGSAGNGAASGGAPYNPALHQDGAIGRFFTVGAAYRF